MKTTLRPPESFNRIWDIPFIREAVETGSTVHTDDWLGYTGIDAKGCAWEVTTIGGD